MITMGQHYLFQSARLGFREWKETDIASLAAINADPEVMRFFPGTKSHEETAAFVRRMQQQLGDNGYCYFAVDILADGKFIGFIGISEQTFEADFTPCIDIGWRLALSAWGKGYATEGAKSCLAYAFHQLGIKKINAVAPIINLPSIQVMQKIGMKKVNQFTHPLLLNDERLRECVLYEIDL